MSTYLSSWKSHALQTIVALLGYGVPALLTHFQAISTMTVGTVVVLISNWLEAKLTAVSLVSKSASK